MILKNKHLAEQAMENILKPDFNILDMPGLTKPQRPSKHGCDDIVRTLSEQKLRFKELSFDIILQLLIERQAIKDKNKSRILGEIEDVSSDIFSCENIRYSILGNDHEEKRLRLTKQKADLEAALREEDINLWRDTEELRRMIIVAGKDLESTNIKAELFNLSTDNGNKGTHNHKDPEHLQGS